MHEQIPDLDVPEVLTKASERIRVAQVMERRVTNILIAFLLADILFGCVSCLGILTRDVPDEMKRLLIGVTVVLIILLLLSGIRTVLKDYVYMPDGMAFYEIVYHPIGSEVLVAFHAVERYAEMRDIVVNKRNGWYPLSIRIDDEWKKATAVVKASTQAVLQATDFYAD